MNSVSMLEDVLKQCGDFGTYHLLHYLFLNLITIISGIATYYYAFGVAEPSFQCSISTSTLESALHRIVSNNMSSEFAFNTSSSSKSQCTDGNGFSCSSFVYDRAIFGRTFTEDGNFVCSRAMKKTWLSTFYQIGGFFVVLTGWVGDKIGRRKVIQILNAGLLLITLVIQIILQVFNTNIDTKFVLLSINQLVLGIDAYSMVFLLVMELTTSDHTSCAGNLALVSFALGEILVTVFAYIVRDWLRLRWCIIGYICFTLPYLYFVPESPYWLLAKHKYDQLESRLRDIAKCNNRLENQWLPKFSKMVTLSRSSVKDVKDKTEKERKDTVSYLARLTISGYISFVTLIVYFKISFGLALLNEIVSPYWNTVIGGVVESIGYISASFLMTTRLGRKHSLIIYTFLASLCLLLTTILAQRHQILAIVVSQMGKLAISGALSVAWIYAPELFPTSIRGFANGVFVFAGRIGAILAPIIETATSSKNAKLVLAFYTIITLVGTILVFLLPETRSRSFHTEDEDESFRTQVEHSKNDSAILDAEKLLFIDQTHNLFNAE